jgi:hypothetical protein
MFTEPSRAVGIHVGWDTSEIALPDVTGSHYHLASVPEGFRALPLGVDLVATLSGLLTRLRDNLLQSVPVKIRLEAAILAVPLPLLEQVRQLAATAEKLAGLQIQDVLSEAEALAELCFRLVTESRIGLAYLPSPGFTAIAERKESSTKLTLLDSADQLLQLPEALPVYVIEDQEQANIFAIARDLPISPRVLPSHRARIVYGCGQRTGALPRRFFLCSHKAKPADEPITHAMVEWSRPDESGFVQGLVESRDFSSLEGLSIQCQTLPGAEVDEIFLDNSGRFACILTHSPAKTSWFTLTFCDGDGNPLASLLTCLPPRPNVEATGEENAAGRILAETVSAEFLTEKAERRKKTLFGPGTILPCAVHYLARTTDANGSIVVPLFLNQEKITDVEF